MNNLLTKRVRLKRPQFNPRLDGEPGTVVMIGETPTTEGLIGVRLDREYMNAYEAQTCADADRGDGIEPDSRRAWLRPEEVEVTPC